MEIFIFKPSFLAKMISGMPDSDDMVVAEPEDSTKHVKKTKSTNAVEVINLDEDTTLESWGDDDKDQNKLSKVNKNDSSSSQSNDNNTSQTNKNGGDKSTSVSTKPTTLDTIDLDEASEISNDYDKDTSRAKKAIATDSAMSNDSKTPTVVSETVSLREEVTTNNSGNGNTDTCHTDKVRTTDLNVKPASENSNNANKSTTPTPIVTVPVETIDLDEVIVPKGTRPTPIDLDGEEATRNDGNNEDTSKKAVDTIDLEDTSKPNNDNNTVNYDADRENSFVMLLKNNTIMNKIVHKCLNMENNSGIQRVVNKTLLPLYKDADNSFKESESFTKILKKILYNLKHDPNHKFLHLKSLCDELNAGKFKRKVPFVTLTTEIEKRKSPRKRKPTERFQGSFAATKNKTGKHYVQNERTDIIDLDISDNEPIIAINDDDSSDDDVVMVTGNYEIHAKNRDTKKKLRYRKKTIVKFNKDIGQNQNRCSPAPKADENNIIEIENENSESQEINGDNSNHSENKENSGTSSSESHKESNHERDDSDKESEQDDKPKKTNNETSDNYEKSDKEQVKASNKEINTDSDESGKENSKNCEETAEISYNESSEVSENECTIIDSDSGSYNETNESNKENSSHSKMSSANTDLLVPHNSVAYKRYNNKYKAISLEKRIQVCKKKILELEEKEVINDYVSPYILCDRYKAEIVKLYKRLCDITGHGDVNLHRQRAVRLHVVEGHPPGPVKRLEEYLNGTIDETGAIPLPDFHDVVNCVGLSNLEDGLGWTKQDVMKEAIALFTHCGHALRKQRQRREYKDLLSLVKDEQLDENDPAEQDPQLLAKLQANQLIAKANEEEVMDRFARMEGTSMDSSLYHPTTSNNSIRARMENCDSSDSDNDSEVDETPRKRIRTNIIHTNFNNRESSDKQKEPTRATNEGTPKKPIQSSSNITSPTVENLRVHDELNEISDRINTNQNSVQTTLDTIVSNWKAPTNITDQPLCITNVSSLAYNTQTHSATNTLICKPSNNTSQNLNNLLTHSTGNKRIESITSSFSNTQIRKTANTSILNTMPNSAISTPHPSSTSEGVKTIMTVPTYIQWNTLQKIGQSNTYVIAINCDTRSTTTTNNSQVERNYVNIVNKQHKEVGVRLENPTTEQPMDTRVSNNLATAELANKEDIVIKTEIQEETPEIDIQKLLDELGDNYIKTVFDIEDPFVAIDISDSSSDDDL